MKTLTLVQGSDAWHSHRATAYNASDAPAMLGISKYKSRSQLLKEMTTGIGQDFDAATERMFVDGHRFEALARPLAEQIIGETLSPVTGTNGKYSASFDGITFDESIIFEHKTLNADIRSAMGVNGNTGGLAEMYRVQMEHQLLVSCADKCLFMASKWDGETCIQEVHGWYLPDMVLRDRIIAGWAQFEKDLANYEHVEVIDAPEADAIQSLPSVTIQVSGEMTLCNLDSVTPKFDDFLEKAEAEKANISIHNGDAIAKFSRAAAMDCKLTAKSVVSQMTTVNEAVTKLELYAKKFDAMGLAYEKEVDRLKEIEKVAALNAAKSAYAEHVAGLQAEIQGVTLVLPPVDFQLAIKGLKTVESKNNALNTALANGKIAADAVAKDLRHKLANMNSNQVKPYAFLFADLQQIIYKPADDFTLLVTSRIDKHRADEAARLEAERARIQAQEEAKAQAKAKAEQDALTAKTQAEERAKIEAEVTAQHENDILAAQIAESASAKVAPAIVKPSDGRIIEAVMHRFNCSHGTACDWIIACAKNIQEAA